MAAAQETLHCSAFSTFEQAQPAAALQHMQDATDHPPVICPILAPYIRRKQRRDLLSLLVVQPKQVASHILCSFTAENH
jgi:hypothetical protein